MNRYLAECIECRPNCYVYDVDAIAASFGRKYIQDDALWQTNHGAVLSDGDFDQDQVRLEPVRRPSEAYGLRIFDFVIATWNEIISMYRTVKAVDQVKMIIMDLDDTMWRGVFAEEGVQSVEGWPLGIAEALLFLKKRGMILAIASKNDSTFIQKNFDSVFGNMRLRLEDFALHRISWSSKAEGIGEIMQEANLLPQNVVFIDDNPVERASAQDAFPGLRVLGSDLYSIRRILLWAPETQVAQISAESSRRTEMVAAQVERNVHRSQMSREDFLSSLGVCMSVIEVDSVTHPKFQRAAELLNKTNQFNTSGRRWSHQEFLSAFSESLRVFAFEVSDKFTDYGVVVVVLVGQNTISQFAMSCRVVGLGVEEAAIAEISRIIEESGFTTLRGIYLPTANNYLCNDLFEKTGFVFAGDVWTRSVQPHSMKRQHVMVCQTQGTA